MVEPFYNRQSEAEGSDPVLTHFPNLPGHFRFHALLT